MGGGEGKTASLARETARLAANGAMPDVSPAAGTPAETGAAAAPAVAAPGTAAPANAPGTAAPPAAGAPAMPSVPALCKDISRAELKQYLKEYSTESGEKLFAAANVDMLEHLPMSTVYEASKSSAKWETVANMLFPDSKAASEIFLIKVREAKKAETEAAASAKKSSKVAWKEDLLAARRAKEAEEAAARKTAAPERAPWCLSTPVGAEPECRIATPSWHGVSCA